ncbi:MAG: phospholipase D family protein [Chitinispirillaceae bacterium]|nr:phospholipase D family protein [Chitinispirillaceae bacterium]
MRIIADCLSQDAYESLRMIVAFAKLGPLVRLKKAFQDWRRKGKTIEAIIGIDAKGTSEQALRFALENFDTCRIAGSESRMNITFHPKVYLFDGANDFNAFIGSNNLTIGGLETNFETFTQLKGSVPENERLVADIRAIWDDAQRCSFYLNAETLLELSEKGRLADETKNRQGETANHGKTRTAEWQPLGKFPHIKLIPPSPIPKEESAKKATPKAAAKKGKRKTTKAAESTLSYSRTLVIQVFPHHNGEILLSKIAVNQNPQFFGYPFKGRTKPKFDKNTPYFQRTPDPVVNISVYDSAGNVCAGHGAFGLNTVYYSLKHEIRITVPQDVIRNAPNYSILVMRQPDSTASYDYDIDVFAPGSQEYDEYLAVCNQTLPSGGKAQPRKFGWL